MQRGLPFAVAGTIAALLTLALLYLCNERTEFIEASRSRARLEAQLLAEHSGGLLRETAAVLQGAARWLADRRAELPGDLPPDGRAEMERPFLFVGTVANFFALDATGIPCYSFRPVALPPLDTAPLLAAHREELKELHLSFMEDRAGGASWILISRRLESRSGAFSGVLAALIDPDFFTARYQRYGTVDIDLIAVVGPGGRALAAWPALPPGASRVEDLPLFSGVPVEGLGTHAPQEHTGRSAVVASSPLPGYPLRIAVAHSFRRLLAPWVDQAWIVCGAGVLLASVLTALTVWARASRERQRRTAAQLEISRARQELARVFHQVALVASEEAELEGFLHRALREIRGFLDWPAVGLSLAGPPLPAPLRIWEGTALEEPLPAPPPASPGGPLWVADLADPGSDLPLRLPALPGHGAALVPCAEDHLPRALFVYLAPADGRSGELLELLAQLSFLVYRITAQRLAFQERERLQRQLQQVRRLEGLGTMAGGIAHEFNNLLTVVIGNADILSLELEQAGGAPLPVARRPLEEIRKAARQAAELNERVLAFAGKAVSIKRRLCLSALVRESEPRLRQELTPGVRLSLRLGEEPLEVQADPAQLGLVLSSLVRNASESLPPEGGDIILSAGRRFADRAWLEACPGGAGLAEGEYLYLEVRDSGCGMDARTLESTFQPFYSTKFLGRGMGLPASLGLVRAHHGTLRVRSRPGLGTTVTVLLPPAPPARS